MKISSLAFITILAALPLLSRAAVPIPKEIIDLGALVTEDLPQRVSGPASRPLKLEFTQRKNPDGSVAMQGSTYTLSGHAGPHVDAPVHGGLPGGIDSFPAERFTGRLKVVDARRYPLGPTVPLSEFSSLDLGSDDIVFIYTGYTAPTTAEGRPQTKGPTEEAARYLASIPVRAFGTDAWGVDGTGTDPATGQVLAPFTVHRILLARMPLFEQLFNLDQLLGKENLFLVGAPLNIKDGDGMMVRPLVLVY